MLPASVHCTVMNTFKGTIKLRHLWRVNSSSVIRKLYVNHIIYDITAQKKKCHASIATVNTKEITVGICVLPRTENARQLCGLAQNLICICHWNWVLPFFILSPTAWSFL